MNILRICFEYFMNIMNDLMKRKRSYTTFATVACDLLRFGCTPSQEESRKILWEESEKACGVFTIG